MKIKTEELLRMLKAGDDLYFHKEDICRILEVMFLKCQTLHSKSLINELRVVFSCVFDDIIDDEK